jgi:magnesium transporter
LRAAVDSSQDADGSGMLVNCVAYQRGQKLADIPIGEIRANLSRPDCFVWVAIKDPEPGELEMLADEFDLHPLAVEDAQKGHQRPKIDEYGSMLFVVLSVVEKLGDECHTGEVSVFVGPQFAISIRRGAQQGFAEVRHRCEHEPELLQHGPAYVLYTLMDTVVDRYFPVLDMLTQQIEEVEERIFTGQTTREQIETLYSLKRQLMVLDHACVPLIEVTGKLHGGRVPPICSGLQDYFRDVSDHLLRLKQSLDSLRDMVATAISMNLSLITIQENEVTKRLAAYAALIAVPTLVAGIYGMNFRHMPEIDWAFGYPLSLGVMAAIDLYLVYRFRKAKWM